MSPTHRPCPELQNKSWKFSLKCLWRSAAQSAVGKIPKRNLTSVDFQELAMGLSASTIRTCLWLNWTVLNWTVQQFQVLRLTCCIFSKSKQGLWMWWTRLVRDFFLNQSKALQEMDPTNESPGHLGEIVFLQLPLLSILVSKSILVRSPRELL